MNVWLALVDFVFGDFESGDVDGEGSVEEFEFAGGIADASDGTTNDEFVTVAKAAGAGEVR